MRFVDIPFAAGQAASADPRTAPQSVPDAQIVELPKTLPNTDNAAGYFVLVLEGTATQTMDVTLYAQAEPAAIDGGAFAAPQAASARQFYQISASTTLTVGVAKTLAAVQGRVYVRTGAAPAAASTLRIGAMASPIP